MLDFVTISQAPVRAVTPLALLYSTVGVLRQVELRKLPVYISGRVVYPISSLTMPGLRAKLIINATSQRLKFWRASSPVHLPTMSMACRSSARP